MRAWGIALAATLTTACASQQIVTSDRAERVREIVGAWIGTPYRWRGASREGTDCSGFTQKVMAELGVDLPRRSRDQARVGLPVERDELEVGDLLFFDLVHNGRGIDHVGLYMGEEHFAHASLSHGVLVDRLDRPVYRRGFRSARRVLPDDDNTVLGDRRGSLSPSRYLATRSSTR